jgi:hypothetical protein
VAGEVLLAILVSGLGLLGLPRRRVRENLAAASRLGRIQYGLLVGPSLVLAVLLWLDIWLRSQGRAGGQLFILIIIGGGLWLLIVAATGLPGLWSGRSRQQEGPPGWVWGGGLYRSGLRATPTIFVALFLVILALAASLLSRGGHLDARVFDGLAVLALLAVLLAFSVWLVGWPALLIPPSLRSKPRAPREVHGKRPD